MLETHPRYATVVVALFVLLTQSPLCSYASKYSICGTGQFTCKDGSCILQEKMCDGRLDCLDNSDEVDCDTKMCRKPNWFQCAQPNGPCLSADLICNGVDNCPGGEDEHDCVAREGEDALVVHFPDVGTAGWHSTGRNCSEFEYTCQTDKSCIPLDFMCDGNNDCQDSSDEIAGCIKAQASCRGFFCANKKCLESKSWLCDGVDDCGDGSDEHKCPSYCTTEQDKFLCSDNSTCLNHTRACDGTQDCPDGSDESVQCASAKERCTTMSCPAAAKCIALPQTGAQCICPRGYRQSLPEHNCVDIDECQEFGICSQGCENLSGGYRCTCDSGYVLLPDNKTCQAHGAVEPMLFYTTQMAVMGMHLRSKRVFTVARNLSKVIGVAYDGTHIYWTNLQNEAESIVKAKPDGSHQEILLTSGLDAPEDLAIDWLTGNIYFSDNLLQHIAVCSNDGLNCAVLVTVDVHYPRCITLWPQRGQMFWTDWGSKPMIVRASMDGSHSTPLVTEDIHWPNGITLDLHNNRVYWVDAKLSTVESMRPDGTDRRKVLKDILKHPYGLAIFEDNIYWSDWGTRSIHTCNKFTGKHHKVIAKDRKSYAVHIYHAAKQSQTDHACLHTRCSHLCLLNGNHSYTCACPDGMQLSTDQLRCVKTYKKQQLFIGLKSSLLEMDHTIFGRHVIGTPHQLSLFINHMAYNSVNRTIFIADNLQRKIFEYDVLNKRLMLIAHGNIGNVTGMAFDHLSHALYWTDSEQHVVEVLSLRNHERAIVNFFSGLEAPIDIAVVPEDGVMFIALRSRRHVHIDQLPLSGIGEQIHAFEDELGDDDIKFAVDYETKTLYWSDSDLGRISFTNYRNLHAYTFRGRLKRPYSLAIVDEDIFWSNLRSPVLYWTHKSNLGPLKRIESEITKDIYAHMLPAQIPLLASAPALISDHPCQHANGGCSHVCVTKNKYTSVCLCPRGLVYKDATNHTCIEMLDCEFRCRSGECLTQSRRCNGRRDCPDGSDEEGCDAAKSNASARLICTFGKFACHNHEKCIDNAKRCDGEKQCSDGSDEEHCDKFDNMKKCHEHQHACDNGHCVDLSVVCDKVNDCGDNSDEANCQVVNGEDGGLRPLCSKNMFQCNSGTCIAKNWECDGKLDCVDGSDEHEKCGVRDCPANMHKCLLGQCIAAQLVCDGNNDCGDFSDEANCHLVSGSKHQMKCGDGMYQCTSDASVCLNMTAKCNGTAECPRGEDEADCGNICSIYEFKCHSNDECIHLDFRCDHDKDCPDGSDELNCEGFNKNTTHTSSFDTHEQICEEHMFDCKDGRCVDLTRVCDGFPDCDNGADEDGQCNTACKSGSGRRTCDHKCRATPTGAVCSCFHGYKLTDDRRTCVDVDECVEQNPCAQICENAHGSYRCSCYPEFMLRPDKTTCKSIESKSALLFTSYDEVRNMTEQPITLTIAWSANDTKISGFDLNVHKRHAYFSTENEDILYMVDVENGTIIAGLTIPMPSKVAVDWITDNVYVVSRQQQFEINVCSFAAKMCGRVIQASRREVFRAIAVDGYNRKLFYVSSRAHTFGPPASLISIANLDGKKREMLLSKNLAYITAISTDPYKKLLYYTDLHSKSLQVISYQLGESRMPITIIQKDNSILHPSGLSVYENQAFIVNIGAKEAVRCQLFGTHTCHAFNLNILNAEDIIVDGVSRQPLNRNPCDMAQCKGLCVQAEYGYECMCGDAIVNEHVTCPKHTHNEITSNALLLNAQATTDGNATVHVATALTLSLLFIVLVVAAVGYMYYRRVKPGQRDFNINLHFQNPLSSLGANSKTATFPSTTATTTSTYASEREKLPFTAPFYRFLQNFKSRSNTEMSMESSTYCTSQTLGAQTRMSNLLSTEANEYDVPTTDENYDSDARARLVP